MGNKFGWHSGVLTCKDAKIQGDLYVQDDIVFSDVNAGVLGVTGGIDMQSTVSAIGIDMGGTFSTAAINIDGTCAAIGISFGTGIAGRPISMVNHIVSDTAGLNASIYLGEAISRTAGEQITLYAKQNWSGSDTTDMVAARPIDGKVYIDSGAEWTDASCVTSIFGYVQVNGTLNGSSIYIHALHGEIYAGSGTYTEIEYEACLGLKNANTTTISTGNRYFAHMSNLAASTVNSAMHIKQAAESSSYVITNLFSFENCAEASSFVTTAYTGDSAWVPNSKGTFTQCGQLQILIGTETYYIPYGTVA